MKDQITFIARVLWRPFWVLIRARGKLRGLLVGGLEPRSRKSGTRKFLGGSDRSPKIIKGQGMKLLTFFVACLCQLGGTEIRCEEENGSQNACTNLFKHIFFWTEKNKKQPHKTWNTQHTSLGSWQSPISANEWIVLALFFLKPSLRVQSCLLHKSFLSYTLKFALWERTSHYRRPQQ